MKRVLILGVSAVQYDSIKLLNEMGLETHAIARDAIGPGVNESNNFEAINFAVIDDVKNYIKEHDIDLVYSTGSDLAIPIASKISEELNLPHFVSYETAKICNNKDLMRQTLGDKTAGNLPFQILSTSDEAINLSFPFIMKPTDSQGQRGVFLIENEEEFKENFETSKAYSRSKQVIIERYVDGPEVSVNGYLLNGKLVFMQVSDRETWPQYVGLIHKHVIPSRVVNEETNKKLFKILEEVSDILKIENGPVYAQVKIEAGHPYIIEITPRLDGCHMWSLINESQNFNLLKLTYEHLLFNDTKELNNAKMHTEPMTLEFICQEPNTFANYKDYLNLNNLKYFQYYNECDRIKPVNGRYEKIGYSIYRNNDEK